MAKKKRNWQEAFDDSSNGYSAPPSSGSDTAGMWAKSEPPPPMLDTPDDADNPADGYGLDDEPAVAEPPATKESDAAFVAVEDAAAAVPQATADSGSTAADVDPEKRTTTIGPTIVIRGKLKSDENLVVRGRIEAEIDSSKDVELEQSGIINADMRIRSATISGIVVGDIHAQERVKLAPEARVVGDIYTPRLVVEDGASFRGRVEMEGLSHLEGLNPGAAAPPAAPQDGLVRRDGDVVVSVPVRFPMADEDHEPEISYSSDGEY